MAKRKTTKKSWLKLKILFFIFIVALAGFLTWLLIGVLTTKSELSLIANYNFPEFISLDDLTQLDYGSYAVAINGEVVAGENLENTQPTASTAKMILGLAIMQAKPFVLGESGESITIDEDFYQIYVDYAASGGSVSKVSVGEEISEYDALVSVFLPSSNNMADTLAIWAFGSLENYRNYATKMLEDWGIGSTTIGIDASGFDASTTSTAADLAKLGAKVMENPVLKEIVGTTEYTVPVAGILTNTNKLLGVSRISGIKTGFIGDSSGYCLVSGYLENGNIITLALLGAPSRDKSFNDSLAITTELQNRLTPTKLVSAGDTVGYYESWWTGKVKITADEDLDGLGWESAEKTAELEMAGEVGVLKIQIGTQKYELKATAGDYNPEPSVIEKIWHAFGWEKSTEEPQSGNMQNAEDVAKKSPEEITEVETFTPITNAASENCTIKLGTLMLINPNFIVEDSFIAARRGELVSLSSLYGIVEGNSYNGDNLMDAEAATHINDMVKDYEAAYPGHTLETFSCYRAVGTKCGRLCAATGTSDHHTGLTCDLVDPTYGTTLGTDYYEQHIDWQWLKANSYKYGFIDRFPEAWAGGLMSEPLNVDENGSTGLFETWHYRYVGNPAATEIATGKYNNGEYDSLEHYLKARGLVADLKAGACK